MIDRRSMSHAPPTCRPAARVRRGLSLLEVVLALALLVGSLAMIGQLTGLGNRHASQARDLTLAQMLAENKLNELTSGLVILTPAAGVPFPENPEWLYSIELNPTDQPGLLSVRLTVSEAIVGGSTSPVEFTLTRWMRDPQAIPIDLESSGTGADGGST